LVTRIVIRASRATISNFTNFRRNAVKENTPVVKQLYRLSIEPRVVDQLVKLSERLREPRSRLASRLFTEAVMGAKLPKR
jgi:hypothetical protein